MKIVLLLFLVVKKNSTTELNHKIVKRQSDNPWCQLGDEHTMCVTRPLGCNKRVQVLKNSIDPIEIREILDKHNELRFQVSHGLYEGLPPSKQQLPDLTWDNDLAVVAQRWAEQCLLEHDKERKTEKYALVGQNMFWTGSTAEFKPGYWSDAIQRWFNEVSTFLDSGGSIYSFGGSKFRDDSFWQNIGSFTQVIWERTKQIGCGQLIVNELENTLPYQAYLVCNYGPSGNFIHQPVYTAQDQGDIVPGFRSLLPTPNATEAEQTTTEATVEETTTMVQ